MIKNYRLSLIVLVLAFIASILGLSATLWAQQEQLNRVELSLSPQVWEVSANPGDTVENVFRIGNSSDGALQMETVAKNFTPKGEEGAVDLTEDQTSYSLADWITVTPATAIIQPKTTQDFNVVINVPANAEPGGKFGSVAFKTIPPKNEDGAAAVSQEVAPVILVSVAGQVTESANISSFSAVDEEGNDKSFWSNERPIQFATRIENTGNVHFKPSGSITIKNMFGSEVTTINLEEKNVLPDSIRKITTDWDPGFAIGRYQADVTVVYGENNEILTATTTFVVFPYQIVIPAAILIGGLLFVLIKFRKRFSEAFKALTGR